MPQTEITWKIEPHTEIKHEILKRYLQAWLPIISKFGRANYIDGFAGPGKYSNGEDGSPLIAIKSLIQHKLRTNINAQFNFIFIEEDRDRCNHLKNEISKLDAPNDIKCKVHIECGLFEDKLNEILDTIQNNHSKIAPTFVFIDPFGIKGISLNLIKRIMSQKSCEVLINFMYEELNRFITLPQNESHIKSLFGEDIEWRKVKQITNPKERHLFLTSLYQKQLTNCCNIKHVKTFKMKNKFNKEDYVLFFCSNNDLGLIKMKEAMWKADNSGSFSFSDASYDPQQTTLFQKEPSYNQLKSLILQNFKGKEVKIEDLINFVRFETPFLESHLKKPILLPMESSEKIEIKFENKRKKGTYPNGTIIHFK